MECGVEVGFFEKKNQNVILSVAKDLEQTVKCKLFLTAGYKILRFAQDDIGQNGQH